VCHVVLRPALRIAQDLIGLGELPELGRVPRLVVVGMEPLREQAVDPVDGLRLGVRADLQHLVMVDDLIAGHDRFRGGAVEACIGARPAEGQSGRPAAAPAR
jgi:hypothetical protein